MPVVKEKPLLFNPCSRVCKEGYCNARILVCFGVPLLPPSAILLGIAFGSQAQLGLFHIAGLVLTSISVTCIVLAIAICSWQRRGRRRLLKLKQLDAERQEILKKDQQTTDRQTNGTNGSSSSKSRHARKQNSVNINEGKHGMKKSRKDKTKRRPKGTKLPPVKEEDRIRGEEAPRKTHYRSKSDGKTKYTSSDKDSSKPPMLKLRGEDDYDFGELFGPRRHLRRRRVLSKKDRFVDYDSDSSSQAGPVRRVHRRTKSESREQFEASLANNPEPSQERNSNFREKLLQHMGLSGVVGDSNDVFPWSLQQARQRSKSMSECGDSDKDSQTTYSEFSFDIDTPREDKAVTKYNRFLFEGMPQSLGEYLRKKQEIPQRSRRRLRPL
ncbi:uncharacterized protein LOC121380104 isoform X2 [Gigantopelta aegis]|uniref:uncharacterized protein LOC121380104 isoform X2 n=1 Tax=Gigantopelta aegis TaxID=1735272 RepID=UPI001B88C4A2|nr:uncharacterized protein LOC121380104 isoform X2 [Gigantopelta aegis]